MFLRKVTALVLSSVMLANCATAPGAEHDGVPWGWVAAGVVAAVVVVAIVASGGGGGCSTDQGIGAPVCSDERLKQDIKHVDTLPNGLQLYSFHYWNDDRTFVSVMAQDLLKDERFSHAVIEGDSGYYMVNLGALGLGIEGSSEQFFEAGQKALAEAKPVTN